MGVHFAPAVPAPQCIGCKCPRHGAFASPDSLPRGPLPRRRCSGLLAAASDAATFSWFPHTWAEGARGMCLARILPTQTERRNTVPMKTPLDLASLKSPYRSTRCLRRCRSRRAGEPDLRAVWARARAGGDVLPPGWHTLCFPLPRCRPARSILMAVRVMREWSRPCPCRGTCSPASERLRELEPEKRRVERLASLGRFRTLTPAPAQRMGLVDRLDPLQSTLGLLLPEPELCCVPLRRIGIGAVLEMVGNDSLLEQLFHNLCLNAIEP